MSFRCDLLDAAVSEEVLKAVQPAELKLALAALRELESRDKALCASGKCDSNALSMKSHSPSGAIKNVILPTVLWQAHWSVVGMSRCFICRISKSRRRNFSGKKPVLLRPEQKAKVAGTGEGFPRLWHAPTTHAKDRKRMLRLLIKDITVNKLVEQRQLSVSHPLARRCLHRPLRADSTECSRSCSLSFSDCRSHPKPGVQFARRTDRRPTQSRRLHECER